MKEKVVKVEIIAYEDAMFEACVQLLADAFIANPLHMKAFGKDILSRNYGFFTIALKSFRGHRSVALIDNKIVGFIHWVHSTKCQFSKLEKLASMPAMISSLGLESTINVAKWLSHWERCDPPFEHLHLGPIAVSPSARGLGIGTALMQQFCYVADKLRLTGYLETDRPENLPFYEHFDFTILQEKKVLGVTNFFMARNLP